MPSDLFYQPSTSRTHGRARSSSTSSDDMDDYTYDSSSSSSSFAAKRYPNLLPTAPLCITRRGSTSSITSTSTAPTASPQVSPNRASFRPLPKVPEALAEATPAAVAAPSPPPPRAAELAPDTPQSARLRRLPVPPIRSPGGDDARLLAARRRSAQRPAGGLKRSNTRTADFAMNDVIDWDQLGDILCDIDED